MENSRIKKASKNIVWLVIYELTAFVCNLILPRLIISTYGSAYNGLISSITQFMNFVAILRLGVAGATRVALYKSLADDDIEKTSAIVRATELYMRRIGYIILGFIATLAIIYPLIIKKEFGFVNTAVLIVAIGIGTFSQYFFGITYRTLLQADQRLYITNIVQILTIALNTALSAFLITRGCSIQVVKIVYAVIFTISPILLNRYVIAKYKLTKKCTPDFSALDRKKDVMGHSIANIVHENTDIIVLTLFTDIKFVSVYTVYNLVMSGLKQIMSIFTTGIEAVFGNMWAKGEMESIKKNLSYYEFLISVFISVMFSATIILILPFVKLYTRGVTDIEYIIPAYAVIITIAQAFYCFRVPYLTVTQAAGHYKETRNGAFFEAGLNLFISIVLVQFIGILGTAIGTLCANLFRTIQYSVYTSDKLIMRKRIYIVKRLIWVVLNIVIAVSVVYLLFGEMAYADWGKWVIVGFASVIIGFAICIITSYLFYKEDAKGLMHIGKRVLRRK